MKVSCPSCDAKYTITDDKVVGKKIKVRCKTCGTQILVDGTGSLPQGEQPSTGSETDSASDSGTQPESLPPSAEASMQSNETDAWTVNLSETEERTMTTSDIVEAALKNELSADVFVWKDGMGDWLLVTDVPELRDAIEAAKGKAPASKDHTPGGTDVAAKLGGSKAATAAKAADAKSSPNAAPSPAEPAEKRGPIVAAPGSALAKKMASAKAASLAPKAEPAPDKPKEAKEAKPLPEKKAAMRTASKRPGSTHDLFAAVEQAGSEIDVDTSGADEPEHKATGARNENSVLFSLDALKTGATTTKAAPTPGTPAKKAPPPPTKRLEDLMTFDAPAPMGAIGGGLLLSGNDALLTAPAPPPPKPEPKPVPVIVATPGAAPVMAAKPKNKAVMIALVVVGVGVVGTAGAFIALKLAAPETPAVASASASAPVGAAPSASAPAVPSTPPAASAAVAAASAEPETPAPSSAVAPNSKAPATGKPVAATKPGEGKEPSKPSKPESKPEPTPAAAGSFSKDAAVAALSVAASQATVCKKPEGPWGTGKCLVTFAPSGRVTTANVTGAPFAGTPVGGCVSSVFRRAKIPAFNGEPVTVSKSFTIAP